MAFDLRRLRHFLALARHGSVGRAGAVPTLLAVCGTTRRTGYFHIVMAAIVGPVLALVAVIVLGTMFGAFQRDSRCVMPSRHATGAALRSAEGFAINS